jgi:hypothetical protein
VIADPPRGLISFDIDGTLEVGDPVGPISMDMVREAKKLGYVIGSCSDRIMREQREIWKRNEIVVDFVSLKQNLELLRDVFDCDRFIHIGDTIVDERYAAQARFDFRFADDLARQLQGLVDRAAVNWTTYI